MSQFNFIAGLPRSGSTLLAAILRQNPLITASMSSPVGGIFNAMQKAISNHNESAMFLTDGQRERLLRHIFEEVYADANEIVFDTNRMWPSKMSTLVRLFPSCKMICCVRPIGWVVDSVERLVRSNAYEISGIFNFEPGGTVYSRVQGLCSSNGLVGFALDALREGFYGEHANHMLLVEYESLVRYPSTTFRRIYDWLEMKPFNHDFEHVEQVPGAAEFDAKLGTPGLHKVGNKVVWREQQTVLPPELFKSFPPPFWRISKTNAPVIYPN